MPNQSVEFSSQQPVGAVFTPLNWAIWAVERLNLVKALDGGATVCDPTAGEGIFALALAQAYVYKYGELNPAFVNKITLIEKQPEFLKAFQQNFKARFGLEFPKENLICTDIITKNPDKKWNYFIGNPPWANFTDLSTTLKEKLKPYFIQYNLVKDRKKTLWGGSRVDIAALVLNCVFTQNLEPHGRCGFFLPISLFLNEGAHNEFRTFNPAGVPLALNRLWDFKNLAIFPEVATRFCFAEFTSGEKTKYPIDYHMYADSQWVKKFASPVGQEESSFMIKNDRNEASFSVPQINLQKWQKPRQGINTCGANDVFIFKQKPDFLPPEFIYPLVTNTILAEEAQEPQKYILLPYHSDGKPLTLEELKEKGLYEYLKDFEAVLSNRKGLLINTKIKKGIWWALLGIGPYSFAPYKLIWISYGGKSFSPKILSSWGGNCWQANQAMQAYIPAKDYSDLERIQADFVRLGIENQLRDQRMEGTCNWAQPGRISRFLNLE